MVLMLLAVELGDFGDRETFDEQAYFAASFWRQALSP